MVSVCLTLHPVKSLAWGTFNCTMLHSYINNINLISIQVTNDISHGQEWTIGCECHFIIFSFGSRTGRIQKCTRALPMTCLTYSIFPFFKFFAIWTFVGSGTVKRMVLMLNLFQIKVKKETRQVCDRFQHPLNREYWIQKIFLMLSSLVLLFQVTYLF